MEFSSRELPGLFFRKVIRDDMGNVSLDPQMMRLLLAIDENKPISQVAKEVGMNLPTLRENLIKLANTGLVEHVEKDGEVLKEEFIHSLKDALTVAVGPMADLLIEEGIDEIGVSQSRISKHLAPELINYLARQIPREDKRIEFQKAMIKKIST
ncbi:MAG: hypothetical protein JRJ12_09890 [Deltaproteobacteria bacterium]|nr:hypothetical protein [Deltaproteobacteria bacterium]MBW2071579.1 hypothetical protein [Deltaproteobacteria bacterium]